MGSFDAVREAASYIRPRLEGRVPVVAVTLGSGLGRLAEYIADPIVIPYRDVPGFPVSTALGHHGNFICGYLAGKCVIAMQGRIHFYEGYPIEQVVLPIRVMIALGARYFFVSNAAGACNLTYKVGDLMLIKGHINMIPNPLIGPNDDSCGTRFPDMTWPYDPELLRKARTIAGTLGYEVKEGVYLGDTGPTYETPSEYRFYRIIGADAVGMSTVPEVIAARHMGVPVFGISVITNQAMEEFGEDYENDGGEVVKAANAAAEKMEKIFEEMIKEI